MPHINLLTMQLREPQPLPKEAEARAQLPPVNLVMSEVVKHQRPTWIYLSNETAGGAGASLPKRKISLRELLSMEGPQ